MKFAAALVLLATSVTAFSPFGMKKAAAPKVVKPVSKLFGGDFIKLCLSMAF